MADVSPLRALHYDLVRTDGLDPVIAPPYDVVDAADRAALLNRSPHNVVALDLPVGPDPYGSAARTLQDWIAEGILVRDPAPALWALEQAYRGPDGTDRTRRGILARVRVEPYGPGRIRPHERTHPGPKEDRLRLTRATQANLSPIFALYDDPADQAWGALAPHLDAPFGVATDLEGTRQTLWRVPDPTAHAAVHAALADVELLIADGHHRYETSRVFAEEGDGNDPGRRWVYMCLVALQDPGLAVFPTHRLIAALDSERRAALDLALQRHFVVEPIEVADLRPTRAEGAPLTFGLLDGGDGSAHRLTLRDPARMDLRLPDASPAYRRLDTAVLEALVLEDALGMGEDEIAHLRGLGYSRTDGEAVALVRDGTCELAFFMGSTPIEQVQAIAAAGESMPPKSTFFHPKVPTGLLINPLDERH